MCNLFHLRIRTQSSFVKVGLRCGFSGLAAKPKGMSPPWNRPPSKFLDSGRLLRSALFASFQPSNILRTQTHSVLKGTMRWMSSCMCLWSGTELIGGDGAGGGDTWPSAERPGLQVHDSKVVSFWEAAVVEGEAGAAAAEVQILIHPQTKVTTERRECRVIGPNLHILDCWKPPNIFLMIRETV